MKTKILLIALAVFPAIFNAQVGVGTTTVNASAKFQIDATNKGFLQPRVTLTGTADSSTIASPATGLMVYNTATAGTGSTSVTPGIYYYNGTAWQRVADQLPTTFVNGSLGSAYMGGEPLFAPSTSAAKTSGASITLPPGKWEVFLQIKCLMQQFDPTQFSNFSMNYWLQDNQTAQDLAFSIPSSFSTTSDAIFSGGATFNRAISNGDSDHSGSFFINNATAGNKTYYLYFFESAEFANANDTYQPFYYSLGGSTWKGNRFYAVKIN
jgi:hypothetical protein